MCKNELVNKLQNEHLLEKGLLTKSFLVGNDLYIYDAISAEIIKTSKVIADIVEAFSNKTKSGRLNCMIDLLNKYSFNDLLKGVEVIKQKQLKEGLLKVIPDDVKIRINHFREKVGGTKLMLELSQDCNFRCKYCPSSGNYYETNHLHTNRHMKDSTALKSIDFFLENSNAEKPGILFYGGEPLLKKKLIFDCIEFALRKKSTVRFFIQTNGYLLDEAFVRKVRDKNVSISVSLDGPPDIHDHNRVLKNGKSTFKKVIDNIVRISKLDSDFALNRMSFIVTVSNIKDMMNIAGFFTKHPILKKMKLQLGFLESSGLKNEFKKTFYLELTEETMEPLFKEYMDIYKNNSWKFLNVHHALFFPIMRSVLHRRPIQGDMYFRGLCKIASQHFFVDIDGNFRVCEKKYAMPKIVDTDNGVNKKIIKKMEEDFLSTCEPCSKCWALTMCSVCWQHLYDYHGKYDPNIRKSFCKDLKDKATLSLKLYTRIINANPNAFNLIPKENWKLS